MTATTLTGQGFWLPDTDFMAGSHSFNSLNVTIDAANEACHFVGYVSLAARTGTKTISSAGGKIHWTTGTSITFNNGSTNLRVGIQDVTTGVPARGDGTFDVYADLVGGTDTISVDAWMTTAMESGTKDITHGQLVCIAITATARGGADSVLVRGSLMPQQLTTQLAAHFPQVVAVTAGPTYTSQALAPVALIEFDDGTYGFIDGALVLEPVLSTNFFSTASIDTGTNPDEYALIFELPVPVTVDALMGVINPEATTSDFELILYSDPEGTPAAIETIAIDANQVAGAGIARRMVVPLTTPRALSANTKYAVAVRPTTTNNITVLTYGVNDAAHWAAHSLGTNGYAGTRIDQTGAFSPDTVQRVHLGFRVSALDDGTGSGSGGQRIFGG